MTRQYKSDAQANAEAVIRREQTYSAASGVSFSVNWDWHKREPRDLRDVADMIRRAYADEIPSRLHNQDLADDGTPKMTPQAEGYIFGSDEAGTAAREVDANGNPVQPLIDYYRTPFRAALAKLRTDSAPRAAIVSGIAAGSLRPMEAAMSVGVPAWCAKLVAEDVLRAFMRSLSDLKVSLPPLDSVA